MPNDHDRDPPRRGPADRRAAGRPAPAPPGAGWPTAATTTTPTAASVPGAASWLHQFGRLLVRFERRADMHEAFLVLGCCLICLRKLQGSF
jgi:hypothetical protein